MKHHSKFMTALVAALIVSAASSAQTSSTGKTTHKKTRRTVAHKTTARRKAPVVSAQTREIEEMREQLSGQQVQIDALKNQLSARDQQVAAAQQGAAEAQSQVASAAAATAAAAAQTTQNAQDVQQLKVSVGDLNTKSDTLTQTVVQNQATVEQQINSPTTLHYKGVTIQPGGFVEFAGVWRQRSVNSDINTPFNSIPFPSAQQGHVSELNFTARQSRVSALVTGDAGKYKLQAYVEADFLGTGTSSNNNQSNSYVLRQRQFWGSAETASGFRLTGGQMWSLVTEDAHGTDNRTEILPNTIDPQYMVGFNWTRQPGVRLQQRFTDAKGNGFTLAIAAEQAQITNFTVSGSIASAVPANYFFAGPGQNGGLYNAAEGAGAGNAAGTSAITTYANNVAPDVMVKAAWDAPRFHLELGGLARFLRDYYYPITRVTTTNTNGTIAATYTYQNAPYVSSTAAAGGGFGALRVKPVKAVEIGVQGMAGQGIGRYGSSQLADATLKPSGALEPIKNYHGLFSLVTHEGKKLDIFAFYGGEYAQRTLYNLTGEGISGQSIGYGVRNLNDAGCYALPVVGGLGSTGGSGGAINQPSTAPCGSPTRYIQEGMFGFTYRVVDSPRFGRLLYGATYSYVQRNLWSGSTSAASAAAFEPVPTPTSPRAEDSMIHVNMRYYIP